MIKIPSRDVKDWLESETHTIFSPVHVKAEKLLDEMRKALEEITGVCRMLLENSRKEIEKRNMKTYGRARALNKLARLFLERIRQIDSPDKVSYDSIHEFVQEIKKAFVVTEVDVRKWFPRISPFFIRDRRKFLTVFEKTKESHKELHRFLTEEYVKTKTLEETFELIDKLLAVEGQMLDLEAQKEKADAEKASFSRKIAETQKEIVAFRNRQSISQLNQTTREIKELRAKVKHTLRHLRKPFIKLQSLTTRGGGSNLTPKELERLSKYSETPFDALATEETNYPLLRRILRKLNRAMSEGKLKLKADRKRKAERDINEILNKNSMNTLHQKCKSALMRKRKLSTSTELKETEEALIRLQKKLDGAETRKELVESREKAIERTLREARGNIRNHRKEIEKNILDFTGKSVKIEQKPG
jgi:hypothetical protein